MKARPVSMLLLVLSVTAARAGVVVELAPAPSTFFGVAPQQYLTGEVVRADVLLRMDPPGDDLFIRFLQFDFSDTRSELEVSLPVIDEESGASFWDFGSALCGTGCYRVDDDLGEGDPGPGVINIAWAFDFPMPQLQLRVPGDGSAVRIGALDVVAPDVPGSYRLDLLNADDTDHELGAQLMFGFDGDVPQTLWRAVDGSITGGNFDLIARVPDPSTLILLGFGASLLAPGRDKHGRARAWLSGSMKRAGRPSYSLK